MAKRERARQGRERLDRPNGRADNLHERESIRVDREGGPRGPRHGEEFKASSHRPVAGDVRRPQRERDHRRKGAPWWIWLLLLAAAALIIGMLFLGGSDETSEEGATDTTNEETTNDGINSGGSGSDAAASGALNAGDTDLITEAAGGGSLTSYEGQPVRGEQVNVDSVVSDEGFWVGPSATERVFVHVSPEGESAPDVDAGDTVSLSGTVKSVPEGFAEDLGVTEQEGSGDLQTQGAYVEAETVTKQ